MESNSYNKAFNAAVRYLSYKSRTEKEIIDYLTQKYFASSTITSVINKLQDIDYINDDKYSKEYIYHSIEKQTKGINFIRKELEKKGINEKIIEQYIPLYTEDLEKEIVEKIVKKYYFSKKNLPLNKIKANLYSKLIRNGFSVDSINTAFKYLDQDQEIQAALSEQQENHYEQAKITATQYYKKYIKKEWNIYKIRQKIYSNLLNKGYESSLIKNILDEIK